MRNLRSTANGVARTNSHDTSSISSRARTNPTSGDSTIAAVVLPTPLQTTAPSPALAVPAPTRPPISACELLDGIPASHVTTFHTIAPASAPKMTRGSTMSTSMMPVPTVCATCRPKNRKAMKLKKAAQATAYCGRSTRVDTMVAIELAASCRPLRKSNSSATAISAISSGNPSAVSIVAVPAGSHVVDHDALQLVGDVVEPIDDFLEVVVDFVAGNERHRVGGPLGLEQLLQAEIGQIVRAPFDLRDLLGQR